VGRRSRRPRADLALPSGASIPNNELPKGLYETLITRRTRGRLPGDGTLVRSTALQPDDSSDLLVYHLARVLTIVLRSAGFQHNVERQVELVNELLERLASREAEIQRDLIDGSAEELLEILAPPDGLIGSRTGVPRPNISLAQNALLVAAKQEPALAAELEREIQSADRIDLLCAFVRWSGIRVLMNALQGARTRGVPIRIITTTYTGSTQPHALEELIKLGAQVKVSYEIGSTRLHAKAWLLGRNSGFSTAYIGSSNLSHAALHDGLEWNIRLSEAASPTLIDRFKATFETYWADPGFEDYQLEKFAEAIERDRDDAVDLVPFDIQPRGYQEQMLYQLLVERERHDRWKNLIVAATGTGKTVVSAFDYRRVSQAWGGASLLFVAHRQEILQQSRAMFRNVLRDGSFGELLVAGERPTDGRHVFASIQSLHALLSRTTDAIRPDAYDVVIVDEFHHAEAPTYRRLLNHVKPRLLLGMTATPERSDGFDVKQWFGGRIAVELRLWDALEQQLLCPFQYFGIADDVDLRAVKWAKGGYDLGQLDAIYTGNDARFGKVMKAVTDIVEDPHRMRALGFCVSVKHAAYMAMRFQHEGISARALSAQSTRQEREEALQDLRERKLNAIFSVDLFNEGLDIPSIDTVMFLRPTESPVVFLQQLGRGLRRTPDKDGLTVLDFIGQQNQRFRFEERFKAMLATDRRNVIRQIEDRFPYLPAGCSIQLDRQSERLILENIKKSIGSVRLQLVAKLKELGDVPLAQFLDNSGYSLDDVYSGTRPGWTAIRREAGFAGPPDPDETRLSEAMQRMLHLDDPIRVDRYIGWLNQPKPPTVDAFSIRDRRLITMLHFDLWTQEAAKKGLQESIKRLWTNPQMISELRQLLNILGDVASRLEPPGGVEPEIPLRLHARYSRPELLAAFGEADPERPPSWREGVKWIETYKTDVFFVTLNKSERRFSPSTRYRDYPVSPSVFHWESQSTTTVASKTGQRYINHERDGTRVLLFVRESNTGDGLGTSPYLFLGPMTYLRHQGERPIAIDWRLRFDMPPDFFQAAKAAV